jgi:hypothetical protein
MRQLPATPFVISRLNDASMRSFGSQDHLNQSVREEVVWQRMEGQLDENVPEDNQSNCVQKANNGAIYIGTLPYDDFQRRLVEHFTIQFHRGPGQYVRRALCHVGSHRGDSNPLE